MGIEGRVRNIVCVGSGTAGVGKSSLAANLAAALCGEGMRVGVLDADLWRQSIPSMLGVHGTPTVSAAREVVPLEGVGGVKVISLEFFRNDDDEPITWREPMLRKAIRQFIEEVAWGELDYLFIDLPPGTGDVSKAVAEFLPAARLVLVTTPQEVTQKLARASLDLPETGLAIAGVVENLSGFRAPSGEHFAIFGEDCGQALADELGRPLLGKVPLTLGLQAQPTAEAPLVTSHPDDPAVQPLRQILSEL